MRVLSVFVVGLVCATLLAPTHSAGAAEEPHALAQFDPSSGRWHFRDSHGSVSSFYYGVPGDYPLMGDWDCDGTDTVGMFRPSNGYAYLRNSNTQGFADVEFFFGMGGDIPLVGDWDGDGCDTLAVYRQGRVFISNVLATGVAESDFYFGVPGDIPFAGDFDGNGVTGVGLFRQSSGYTYIRDVLTTGVAEAEFFFGVAGDRMVAGDWDGNGTETVGVFRPSQTRFYLRNSNTQGFADIEMQFGSENFIPVAGGFGTVTAPLPGPPVGTAQPWSDPATWGGQVPAAGEAVMIPADKAVLLDVDPPPLASLHVAGTLVFADRDISLTTGSLMVQGYLQIGTASAPFANDATITLTGARGSGAGMGDRVFGVMSGGAIDLHGQARNPTWARLAQTAPVGATSVRIEQAVDWKPGERIVISSTDFDWEQAEERTITAVAGDLVSFAEPLEFEHYGETQSFGGRVLDERAEVAVLDRSILIQGGPDSASELFGGHMMFMRDTTVRIENVELQHMGQAGVLGRYPVHWHLAGDAGGSYVRGSAIHHSFNRCVTIHGTDNVQVENNVAFDTFGHCYFLEDGLERGNVISGNLGLVTRDAPDGMALLPTDDGYLGPATFWITNPDNTITNNVAGGSDGTGFWFALPEHPTGPSTTTVVWNRQTPLKQFSGNVSHSNDADGLHVDRGPTPSGDTETTWYEPRAVPGDEDSAPVVANFANFTAYKNRNRGVWMRGENHILTNAVLADNRSGASFASDLTEMRNALVVGESANLGTPRHWEATGPGNRSLPQPWDEAETIVGFEFYDGQVGVVDTHFANFASRPQRPAAALSTLEFTDFSLQPDNFASGLSFANGTRRVHMETRPVPGDPTEGEDGYRSAIFVDADGSVTDSAGAHVVVDNPLLLDNSCSYQADWNVNVCVGNVYSVLRASNRSDSSSSIGPVVLIRDDGPTHTLIGTPDEPFNERFRSNILVGHSYTMDLTGSIPDHLQVRASHQRTSDAIYVTVKDVNFTPYIYRDWWIDSRNLLTPVSSMSALQASDGDVYYKAGSDLHLKLIPQDDHDWSTFEICRSAGC